MYCLNVILKNILICTKILPYIVRLNPKTENGEEKNGNFYKILDNGKNYFTFNNAIYFPFHRTSTI